MLLAFTADLHLGLSRDGDDAVAALVRYLKALKPNGIFIAGDLGEGDAFARALDLLAPLAARVGVTPGNHDIWRRDGGDSRDLYERVLPLLCEERGVHYLDQAPLLLTPDLAVVGSMNWYDYSYADPAVKKLYPQAQSYYRRKLFPNGLHNDGRFVRLGVSDYRWTTELVRRLATQLRELPESVGDVILVAHHPPLRPLFYPEEPRGVMGQFWLAYTGNRRMERLVKSDARIRFAVCGHVHAASEWRGDRLHGVNIGGDYHFKRLLLLDTTTWRTRSVEFCVNSVRL